MAEYEVDYDQGPCEFCGQPFPFELLIEHQSGCRPDLLHYAMEDENIEINEASSSSSDEEDEILQTPEVKQMPVEQKVLLPPVETKVVEENNSSANKKTVVERPKPVDIINLDDQLQDSETKIMVFGPKKAKVKSAEKLSFRKPSIPLLNNADKNRESCCHLSDDDSCESLEEFWRRAEIALNKRKIKIAKSLS